MQLGVFLKRFRKAVSLSGDGLAKRIGVMRHSLEKWENAGCLPNYESSVKIQRYFGIESLVNIPEEYLQNCISRELNRTPTDNRWVDGSSKKNDPEIEISEYLHSLNARLCELEKIVKVQHRQIRDLEKASYKKSSSLKL